MSLFGKVTYRGGGLVSCECGSMNWRITMRGLVPIAWCAGFKDKPCKRRYLISVSSSGLISFINVNQEGHACQNKTLVKDVISVSWGGEDAAENASSDAAESASHLTQGPAVGFARRLPLLDEGAK